MWKIATHNSVTGEEGRGLLSWLVTPFSRCQSKTLEEQYKAGVRYFDIRVFRDKYGEWRCGHGLWTARKTFKEVFYTFLYEHSDIRYSLTIEKGGESEYAAFKDTWSDLAASDPRLTYVAVKHPTWHVIAMRNPEMLIPKYKILDGSSWHTYLPIPWLWKKIYYDDPEFNEDCFTMVDFF